MKRQLVEWVYFALIMIALMLVTISAQSASLSKYQRQQIIKVSEYYGLNANKLMRIAYVESTFNQKAIRVNSNNTIDVGMFQINTVHAESTCANLNVYNFEDNLICAALILVQHKKKQSEDSIWFARYHSKTPSRKQKYYNKLMAVPTQYLASNQ